MEKVIEKYKDALKKAAKKISELDEKIKNNNINKKIAIIGYDCRFPKGANDPEKFWSLLSEGYDAVTEIPKDRFDINEFYSEDGGIGKTYTKYSSLLDSNIKEFDNVTFEISSKEAASIDPQHRLLMSVIWNALLNAGLDIENLKGSRTGIFIGMDSLEYFKAEVFSGNTNDITPYSLMGVSQHSAAGRIAYFYDFKGPAIVCSTACSSSLSALNIAVDSLRNRQCDMAIVAGVNLILSPEPFIGLSQFNAISSDGRCKTFDDNADGFGRGEGCGVVILKRYNDAIVDNNNIEAIVKSVSIGQDGKSNGFFAPNGLAEQRVIEDAIRKAEVRPSDIDYIEAHGTGTSLGDFIETQALCEVFKNKKEPIKVGSVKSNIGHLEAAAGMASLIKVLLSIKHKQIPPSINITTPNHTIDWNKVNVVRKLTDWDKTNGKRIAGISSFGISGTLAHVIVEEADEKVSLPNLHEMNNYMLTLSAKTNKSLKAYMNEMCKYLVETDKKLCDISYSSNLTRSNCQYRYALVCNSKDEMIKGIKESLENEEVFKFNSNKVINKKNKIAFLFTGQGSIYKNIGKDFYENSVEYRNTFDKCCEKFNKLLNINIIDAINNCDDDILKDPKYSQPIIFSVEYSLTKVWDSLGIKPEVVIGHSIGEYAAACYSGLVSLDETIKMISIRSKIMSNIEKNGKMVGILTSLDKVESAIKATGLKNVSIAAINANKNVTISGIKDEVNKVIDELHKTERVFVNELNINQPYHSVVVKEYEEEFEELLRDIQFDFLKCKMISTVTGQVEDEKVLGDSKYWASHLSRTVDYKDAILKADEIGINIFIEIGGNATLTGLAGQCLNQKESNLYLPSLRDGIDNYKQLLNSLKSLYLEGIQIDFNSFYQNYKKEKILLPNYCFCGKEFWKDLNINLNIREDHIKINKTDNEVVLSDNEEGRGENTVGDINLKNKYENELKNMVHVIAGMELDEIDSEKELFAFGLDSLLLMTLGKQITEKYNMEIPLDVFFTSLNTIDKIAEYIADNTTVEEELTVTDMEENVDYKNIKEEERTTVINSNATASIDTDSVKVLFENQMKILNDQNEILKSILSGGMNKSVSLPTNNKPIEKKTNNKVKNKVDVSKLNYYIPYHKMEIEENNSLQDLQTKYIKNLEKKYVSMTKKSKELIQNYRMVHASARNSAGFRPLYKEMIYQIIVEKGKGSKIIDVDNNELIDLTMGFGVHLFGHGPEFVKKALQEELENSMPLGPMGRLVGKVAEQISELTGVERVFFCNTGTESDMFAIRIARAVTGRKKIVCFTGSYHGTYDGLLGLPTIAEDGTIVSVPMAPGINESVVKDLILLNYNSKSSLEYIEKHADEIAGVLVETVQSRRPDVQPREFLHSLRKLTFDKDIALIFDEVITGFRISAGGASEFFGVKPDIVTYGKVLGGGMPIGVVAGNAKYLDSVDGGVWYFGDDSVPRSDETRTYVAGTFCHHPMAMAAANATLKYIKDNKDVMYKELNEKTEKFVNRINTFFDEENIPFNAVYFGSEFRINMGRDMDIFYYGMLEKGVYIWEGRNCFLSMAHTSEDLDKVFEAIKATCYEMRDAGFFGEPNTPNSGNKTDEIEKDTKKKVDILDNTGQEFPLSLIQQRLYSQIMISEADPFDMVACYIVKSKLDINKLEKMILKIISRHEMLRSEMHFENGDMYQKVIPINDFKIRQIEQKEKDIDLNKLINDSLIHFDLAKAPLIEVLLIKKLNGDNMIVFHFHHTAADGMSMNIFVQELTALYNNLNLEPINLQYRDFVKWENDYLNSKKLVEDEKFWLANLASINSSLTLPYDYPKTTQSKYLGNTIFSIINKDSLKKIKKITRDNSASLFMMLFSITSVLFNKVSGENNFALLTPVSCRFDGGFEKNIGMFTNTIALGCKIDEEMTFEKLLENTKKDFLQAYGHMNYPYNLLIEKLNSFGRSPFNVMFVYEDTNERTPDINELELEKFEYIPTTQEFDITIELLEKNDEVGVYISYRTDLFEKESIELLAKRLNIVVDQVINNSKIKLSDIDVTFEKEKNKIINEFNNKCANYPKNKTIVDIFEEQVNKTPNNIALVFKDKNMTYKELNEKANMLANRIREYDIKNNDFVAIIADRSIEMIISIIATIKAGATYVPIDPNYPIDRIRYTLNDCKPKIIISYNDNFVEEDFIQQYKVINLKKQDELKRYSNKNLSHINNTEDILYVIYTSGTTGKPKGVMVKHKNLVRLLFNDEFEYDFNDEDVWTLFHSYCFDFSVWEIFGALLYGAKLVILPLDTVKDSVKVAEVIKNNKVTVLNQVPSSFYNLMSVDNGDYMKSLRYLIFGGEALSPNKLEKWKKTYNNVKIVNMYGITETTVHVTYREIGDKEIAKGVSDIGKAIPTTNVYILHQNSTKLCGIMMPGELCVAGDGVTKGYLNREELTKEKFIDNPFGEGKLYRSGDLVRWMKNGNIEYLGRIDEQVKIRGFRIELGEIETAIGKVDGIKDVAVITRRDSLGEYSIYAYLVSEDKIDISYVKDKIKKSLPEYMIPSYMTQINELPLTRNGKLNKEALPDIILTNINEYVEPRTEIESKICNIISEVLNLDRVGIKDDFFEIGGHSLRATRVINRIGSELGVTLPVKTIFKYHTVEELSKLIENDLNGEYLSIPLAEKKEYYEMSSTQKRTYLIWQLDKEGILYNMPQCFKYYGNLDLDLVERTLNKIIERHEILRTEFCLHEGKLIQKINNDIKLKLDYEENDDKSESMLMSEFIKPFNLEKGPLIRAKIVKRKDCSLIMFDLHHIVGDGISMGIIINEFMTLYDGGNLDDLRCQYKDYSEWMKNKNLSSQKEYWINEFSDEIPILNLPLDFSRPQEQSYKGNSIKIEINKNLSNKISEVASKYGATEYMMYLSALIILMGKYSNQEDIVIGTPISGRVHHDTESMIGMFVNTLAMRGRPEKNKKFSHFLQEIKNTSINAYENQEYPFEELVESVGVQRDMSRNPLFDVLLVLQNNESSDLILNGNNAIALTYENKVAKFDLTFSISEKELCKEIELEYCTELFKNETAYNMLQHYIKVLDEVTSDPEIVISNISTSTDEEKKLILGEFNNSKTKIQEKRTIIEQFEKNVERYKDKIAVEFEDTVLTYEEFNEKVNILANKLREANVKPNDFVGIITDRSIEMLIGIYGILKSGAAYVPIDPKYPISRIKYILDDCKPKYLLVNDYEIATDIPVINLVEINNMEGNTKNPSIINKPEDAIYNIYTSGTTGNPKGVINKHSSVANLIAWMQEKYPLTTEDVIMQKTTYVFDVSVSELLWFSTVGARILILKPEDEKNPMAIMEAIKRYNVSMIDFVPSMLSAFMFSIKKKLDDELNTLKYVIVAGEALNVELVNEFYNCIGSKNKNVILANLYGPTEACIYSTYYNCTKDADKVLIGKPIGNAKAYILDNKNLCGIGVPGELCIGGAGVALGYLNRPELTIEKFIPDILNDNNSTIYRTGDLARLTSDGNIEYLGRIDEQVKVRGYRIELGEIENCIRKIEKIKDVALIIKENELKEKAICAFIVSDEKIDIKELRKNIGESLPEYMIPQYIVQIESIPITVNGKLNRKALMEIKIETEMEREYVEPRNEVESALCDVFAEVLGVKKVGITDNFFEIGGDSIKAIRVVSKMREKGYDISFKDIMHKFTIDEIEYLVKTLEAPSYEQGEIVGVIESTPIIKEFEDWNLKNPSYFNQAIIIEIETDKEENVKLVLDALIKHHDILRAVYSNKVLKILSINESKMCDFKVFDYSDQNDIYKLIEDECNKIQSSIDLENGPLVKAAMFKTNKGNYLMICIHHLVVDGVSWRILLDDFIKGLKATLAGDEISFGYKTASYIEWSKALNEYKESSKFKNDLSYWKEVDKEIASSRLINSKEYNDNGEATVNIVLSQEETNDLLYNVNKAFNTEINDILLSALGRALIKYNGQSSIAVALESHGRETIHKKIDIDRTVGWFTNIYPIIIKCNEDIKTSIIETKEMIRKIPSNGISYGLAKELLSNKQVDLYFNYLGEMDSEFDGNKSNTLNLSIGNSSDIENTRQGIINLDGMILSGILTFTITYSKQRFSKEDIEKFSNLYKESILAEINYCKNVDETVKTISDFDGTSNMQQSEFDDIMSQL